MPLGPKTTDALLWAVQVARKSDQAKDRPLTEVRMSTGSLPQQGAYGSLKRGGFVRTIRRGTSWTNGEYALTEKGIKRAEGLQARLTLTS